MIPSNLMRPKSGPRLTRMAGLVFLEHIWFEVWWRRKLDTSREFSPISSWVADKKALFIHIPKTAGTSVYKTLGMPQPIYTHIPSRVIKAVYPEIFNDCFKFSVVRNPWDRLVSTYEFLKSGSTLQAVALSKKLLQDFSFSQFVSRIGANASYRRAVLSENFFFNQAYFLTDRKGVLLVDEVFKFEELVEAYVILSQRFCLDRELLHERKTAREPYQNYYTDRLASIVGQMYRADIERFGYTFE